MFNWFLFGLLALRSNAAVNDIKVCHSQFKQGLITYHWHRFNGVNGKLMINLFGRWFVWMMVDAGDGWMLMGVPSAKQSDNQPFGPSRPDSQATSMMAGYSGVIVPTAERTGIDWQNWPKWLNHYQPLSTHESWSTIVKHESPWPIQSHLGW